jgi:hypothetical protein
MDSLKPRGVEDWAMARLTAGFGEELDKLPDTELRVQLIDEFAHYLQYMRRYVRLTPAQLAHMLDRDLSPECRECLDRLKDTPVKFKAKMEEYARAAYIRECAWSDYLHNGGIPPLVESDFASTYDALAAKHGKEPSGG